MIRTWPALLAWGAGLLHIALGATILQAADAQSAIVLGALIALGLVELAWGGDALRRGRPTAPRAVAASAVVAIAVGVAGLVVGVSPIATAAATVLVVASAAITARIRGPRSQAVRAATGRRGATTGLILGALVVAGIATPALATTDAGLHAPAHVHGVEVGPHAGH